jgi:hypothetical protein
MPALDSIIVLKRLDLDISQRLAFFIRDFACDHAQWPKSYGNAVGLLALGNLQVPRPGAAGVKLWWVAVTR